MDRQKKSTALTLVVLALLGTAYHFLWHDGDEASEPASEGFAASGAAAGNTAGAAAGTAADDSESLHGLLELPYRLEDNAGNIIEHMGYTLSYNSSYRVPNWVAYELLSSELYSGDRKREDEFTPDPLVKGRQAYDRDYVGSGFDRGHMAPAADMKWSSQAMKECFYLSNICPQVHGLNAGAWNDLEKQVRREARYYGAVWVACGPLFESSNPDHIGENHVMVPDSFFKALLARKKDGSGYIAIGFIFPNGNCTRNLTLYAMTVDELERRTGLDFFYNLDSAEQEKAESRMDPYGDWRIRDEVLRD